MHTGKKGIFAITAVMTAMTLTLSGFASEAYPDDPEEIITGYLAEDADKYVKLGAYNGLELEKNVYTVTEEDVVIAIDEDLQEHAETVALDRPCEEGDLVLVDMTLTVDGETREEKDVSVDVGYFYYGEVFDQNMIGSKAGDTLSFSETFGDDDLYSMWPGQTVDFEVTVKEVQETVIPELTEDWVKANTEYASTEEYENAVREKLQEKYDIDAQAQLRETAIQAAMANASFSGYPEELYNSMKEAIDAEDRSYAEMYGMELSEFYEYYGMAEEDIESSVLETVNRRLFTSAMAKAENIEVNAWEVSEYAKDQYLDQGFESPEAFRDYYTDTEIAFFIADDKVGDLIIDQANITEVVYDYSEEDLMFDDSSAEDIVMGLADAGEAEDYAEEYQDGDEDWEEFDEWEDESDLFEE